MNSPPSAKVFLTVSALLILHVILGWRSASQQSVTVDELYHVTGGYGFNALKDYRIHPDNGVLPQRLHALPAVWKGAKPPQLGRDDAWYRPDVSRVGYEFFYERGNDHLPLVAGARAINLIFSVGVGLLLFGWARRLAGDVAGIVALGLASFSPTLLAHGPLATSDMACTLTLNASVGAFWLQLRSRRYVWNLVSGVIFGLACVTKFSAVLLLPVFAVMILVHELSRPAAERRVKFIFLGLLLHAGLAVLIIWATFGFRFSMANPALPLSPDFATTWDALLDRAGWQGRVISWMRHGGILPEGFLWGYTHTYVGSFIRGAFLAGETSVTGWRSFFPLAFLWKSSPAELVGTGMLLVTAGLYIARRRPALLPALPLAALAGVYVPVAIMSHLNIGHRHLLPLYPALFIGTGVAIALAVRRTRIALAGGAALVVAQAATALFIFPHFLAYFNPFAGGPAQGYRLLVDSSLDWGQDLSRVRPWLDRNNVQSSAQPLFLSYFGSGEPAYYGIDARRLPFVNGFRLPQPYVRLEAGIYMISATTLAQVYSPFAGPWTAEFEREFQQLKVLEPVYADYFENASRREALERETPSYDWRNGWFRYHLLRFARLCHYLRVRRVDDHLGYSILIFRLSDREIKASTQGSLREWSALIGEVAERK